MESISTLSRDTRIKAIKVHPLEWVLIIFLIFGGWYWGYRFVPETKYWDDLLYLHTAWDLKSLPYILNRYGTIYLVKLFDAVAQGNPILGGQYFGAFTFSTIIALVYLNARILAKNYSILCGLLAIFFLLTFDDFTNNFGVVLADYTATMMVLVGVLIFILYWRLNSRREFLLFLFGLTFFIAFRSKETGIILGLLIPGFFIDTGEELTLRRFLIKLGIILSGCFLGILVFMVLNGVFLKAPFFGLHPSDIRELIEFNTAVRVNQQDSTDNYLYYIASNSMFLLSLVWIIKSDDGFKRSDRWLWFSVLGIIPFLNLTNVNGGWRIVPHYLTPAIAILSILAPQVIQFDDSLSTRLKNSHGTIVIAASLLASGIVTSILATLIAGQAGWEFYYVVAGVLSPIALCILIFLLCFKKSNILNVIAIVACIGALTLPKATYNVFTTVATKPQPYSRFLPFIEFREAVTCTTDNVLISGTIYRKEGLLSRDAVSSWRMFNLFFRCHMTGRQFSYSLSHEDLSKDLASKSYRYIFLHDSDYQYLIDQKDRSHNIMDRYIIKADKSQQYYLLTINQ